MLNRCKRLHKGAFAPPIYRFKGRPRRGKERKMREMLGWRQSGARRCSARSPCYVCLPSVCPARLLDDLVRQDEERRGKRDPERLCRLAVEDTLELCGLLHGQISRLGTL